MPRSTISSASILRTNWEAESRINAEPCICLRYRRRCLHSAPNPERYSRHAMTYVDAACAPLRKTGQIKIHGPEAFAGMRTAGRLAAECLDMLVGEIYPGVTTEKIDRRVFEFGSGNGALPATLMYRGYRKATYTSVNHVVCPGIPSDKPLREGDIVNVDVTLILDGWHGDSSRMYAVGEIPRRAERLIEVTYEGMMRGIAAIRPGGTTGDIGHAIQSFVEA